MTDYIIAAAFILRRPQIPTIPAAAYFLRFFDETTTMSDELLGAMMRGCDALAALRL